MMLVTSQMSVPSMLISMEGTGKNQLQPIQESIVYALVLSYCSLIEILDQNWPMCWSIVVKEKPTVGSPFLRAFSSDRNHEATKDVSVHFFIYSRNSCKLYQGIPGIA